MVHSKPPLNFDERQKRLKTHILKGPNYTRSLTLTWIQHFFKFFVIAFAAAIETGRLLQTPGAKQLQRIQFSK
jgi:hypothetical protein